VAEARPLPDAVRDDAETMICLHCAKTFPVSGRSRYCGNACRQRAYRARRGTPAMPTRMTRPPKEGTVYYCDECDTRYLGVQYCESCKRFCRRLGAGGLCPCCDEPVAVKDLIEGVAIMLSE
jgi:hypothetical protein